MLSQYICIELVTQAKDFIHTLTNEDPDKILADYFAGSESYQPNCVLEWAQDVDHIDRFGSSLKSILEAAIEIRDRQKNYRYSTIVAIAKEYINQHYSDVGLCLANVASHVKITPNYLSSILSQETGESFIEYLTRIRITKALELLNTNQHASHRHCLCRRLSGLKLFQQNLPPDHGRNAQSGQTVKNRSARLEAIVAIRFKSDRIFDRWIKHSQKIFKSNLRCGVTRTIESWELPGR